MKNCRWFRLAWLRKKRALFWQCIASFWKSCSKIFLVTESIATIPWNLYDFFFYTIIKSLTTTIQEVLTSFVTNLTLMLRVAAKWQWIVKARKESFYHQDHTRFVPWENFLNVWVFYNFRQKKGSHLKKKRTHDYQSSIFAMKIETSRDESSSTKLHQLKNFSVVRVALAWL